jgi:hypothetical protein
MKVYIKQHTFGAGFYIYRGYFDAWKSLGYEPIYYNKLFEIPNNEKDYYVMTIDADVKSEKDIEILVKSNKTFLYTQPNIFPKPWGMHPNFVSQCFPGIIKQINKLDNVKQWTFGKVNKQYMLKWKNPQTILLAFDHINYSKEYVKHNFNYDVCFVGGRANNGFDEKINIMNEYLSVLKKSGLNYGFFIDKKLSHEEECSLLYTSKIAINLHDQYQRILGLDINERNFKALGITGILVSDEIGQLKEIFPNVPTTNSPKESIKQIKQYLSLTKKELNVIKEENRNMILKDHTYICRIKQMLEHE